MGVRFYLVVGFAAVLASALVSTPPARAHRHPTGGRSLPRGRVAGRSRPALRGSPGATRPTTETAVRRNRASAPLVAASAVLSVGLLATWALAGHAAIGDRVPLAVSATIAHLLAMCLWLGGLALVAVCLTASGRAADLAVVLPHFSRLAFACVGLMVGTGTYLAWREVASLDALTGTEYGRTLLVKLVGVIALVALGNLGRLWGRRHAHAGPEEGSGRRLVATGAQGEPFDRSAVRRLRRGVIGEVAVGLAVLGLTTALVEIVPARQD
jgi:copper transport protein